MQFISGTSHESAQQSQLPTRDHKSDFGSGTLTAKDSGANMQERSLQVQITNPGMRTKQTAPAREEKQRLTARTMNVVARSGNQRPSEIDERIPNNFIWGMAGEGEEPQPPAAQPPSVWGNVLLAGIGVAVIWGMYKYVEDKK